MPEPRTTTDPPSRPPVPMPVPEALAVVVEAERGLLGLGMPGCAACILLPASLAEVARSRPGLVVAMGEFASIDDWRWREQLLWPRGIRVSRSSVPALALLAGGEVIATRPGGGPAMVIDRWLEASLGPAEHPLGDEPTPAELEALGAVTGVIARHRAVKSSRESSLGTT